MPSAICFIENLRRQRRTGDPDGSWESGDWRITPEKAESLRGKRIYFHERQAEPSYFGGVIVDYRVLAPMDGENYRRVVFKFIPDEAGRGFDAGRAGWGNEQKTID